MNELQKIDSFRYEVAIAETIDEIKMLSTKGEIMAEMARKLKIPIDGQNKLGRTRIELEKRKRELIEQMFPRGAKPGTNNREIVKSQNGSLQNVGITWKESSDAKIIKEEDELVEEIIKEIEDSGSVIEPKKVASLVRKKKNEKKQEEKKKQREEQLKKVEDLEFKPDIRKGRFQDICKDIPDNSIDHIITDPPYPKEFLQDWSDMGEIAKRILKPGGFCIAYSGKYHMVEVLERMTKNLDFYWQLILFHTGHLSAVHPVKINTGYKPIFIFNKPPRTPQENYVKDVIMGTGTEKFGHKWQQAEDELDVILQNFTKPGDLILDPFAGSGTTGVACLKNKRRSILIDINDV